MSRPCKKDSVWIMENRVQLNTVTAGASGRGKTRRSTVTILKRLYLIMVTKKKKKKYAEFSDVVARENNVVRAR